MSKEITLNMQADSKSKSIYTKAEYAVAVTLNTLRKENGMMKTQITEAFQYEGTEFRGSGFFTTDQYKAKAFGTSTFWPTANDGVKVDDWNIKDDIDLVLTDLCYFNNGDGKGCWKLSGKSSTISVKAMNKAMETGNISIEVETYNSKDRTMTRKGWIYTSKAEWYAICLGPKVMMVRKEEIIKLIESEYFPTSNQLTSAAYETNNGRVYDNARNILVPVDRLLPFARVLDLPEWYNTDWNKSARTTAAAKAASVAFWEKHGVKA